MVNGQPSPPGPSNGHGPPPVVWMGWGVLGMIMFNIFGNASDCNDSLQIENVCFIKDTYQK